MHKNTDIADKLLPMLHGALLKAAVEIVVHLWPFLLIIFIGLPLIRLWLRRSAKNRESIQQDSKNRALLESARSVQDILAASPTQFEHLCRMIFQNRGYDVRVTQPTNDGGIDVVGSKDGVTMVAQCKRWTNRAVGRPHIQQLYGALVHEGADHAYIITTSRFTREAEDFAQGKPITLVGKDQLMDWVKRYGTSNAVTEVESPTTVSENTASEPAASAPGYEAVCATCGEKTVLPFKPTTGKPVYCKSCYVRRWRRK